MLLSRCLQYEDAATVAASLGREGHIVDPAAPAPPASMLGLLARVALDAQAELDAAAGARTQAFEDRGDPGPNAGGAARDRLRPTPNAAAASTAAPAEAETWLTAREIAERRYPGLPHTERGVRKLAAIAGWAFRPRAGRGGGREYPVSALPAAARAAHEDRAAAKAAKAIALPATPAQAVAPADTATATGALPDWRRRRMEARLAILDRIEAQALALGSHRKAQEAFVARASAGLLDDPFPRLLAEATARRARSPLAR